MRTNRIVIELLKKHIEYGKVSEDELNSAILDLDKDIDKAVIEKKDITELLLWKTDLQFIKYR
jgi:hypothetical protein